jgi:hypothetical protein
MTSGEDLKSYALQGALCNHMSDEIHFDHPPLDEVVCGIHFVGVKWSDIYFGLYYTELGERYPHTQRRPPCTSVRKPWVPKDRH